MHVAAKTGIARVVWLSVLFIWWGYPVPAPAQTYYFTTIAGQAGVPGYADGTNNQAQFNRPSEVTLDAAGALYVADTLNNTIRKLTPVGHDWVVSTVAGLPGVIGSQDGATNQAEFYRPNGIAQDAAGNLFIADHNNDTLRKLAPTGATWIVSTIAGLAGTSGTNDGFNTNALFRIPTGITVDTNGNIFVADTANQSIRKAAAVGTDWSVTTIAGAPMDYGFQDGWNDAALFDYPYGIASGPDGALYVTDAGNNALRRIAPVTGGWRTTTIANSSGNIGHSDGAALQATFNTPNGLVLDSATNIFVTDQSNDTIRKLTYNGRGWDVSTIGGVAGVRGARDGAGTNALFYLPWGIAVDRAGALYIADAYNHTIRRGVPLITLQVAVSASQLTVTWPASPAGFTLESSPSISAGETWIAITDGIVLVGNQYQFTAPASGWAMYYRLKR